MPVNPLLRVSDIERSVDAFEQFGFAKVMSLSYHDRPYFVEMRHADETGDGVVMLLDQGWWQQDGGRDGAVAGGVLLYVPVEDIAGWWARLQALPAVVDELREHYYGREFVVQDPDGFRLAFFQPYPEGERLGRGVSRWTAAR